MNKILKGESLFVTAGLIIFINLTMLPASTSAQANVDGTRNLGLGLMLGEPTGVSVKSWLGTKSAFDIGAAWSLSGRNEALHLHADYLYHRWFLKQGSPCILLRYGWP